MPQFNQILTFCSYLMLFLSTLSTTSVAASPRSEVEIKFSIEEEKWLQDNQNFVFYSVFAENFSEISPSGEAEGLFIDYLDLINERLASRFKVIQKSEQDLLLLVLNNQVEGILGTTSDKKSKQTYLFSDVFIKNVSAFFSRTNEKKLVKFSDLIGRKIGVYDPISSVGHSSSYDYLISSKDFETIGYKDYSTLLNALIENKVDFVFGNKEITKNAISDNLLSGIKLNLMSASHSIDFKIATSKNNPELISILNKVIASITTKEKSVLISRWLFQEKGAEKHIIFSKNERSWINAHPVVYYSDISWMPYVSVENGKVEGIAKDYLDLVIKETGLDFQFVPSENWNSLVEDLKDGNITLSLAAGKTSIRENYADFSDPFIISPLAIVTSDHFSYVQDLKQLEGLTVAIPENIFIIEMLKRDFPKIKLIYTDTIEQAFEHVARDRADAYVGNLAVAAYYLRQHKMTNLQIAGMLDHNFTIHFMLRKDNLELLSIINKVLANVTSVEKRMINSRWYSLSYQAGIDPKVIWQVIITASVILLIILYWVGRLRKEIRLRKLTESSLKSARADADRANQAKSEFLANMSHEIRTPMNAVIGFTQLMLETELTKKQQSYLDSIKVGGSGLLHIINDILDLSKIEAGKLSIEYEPVNLYKLLEEMHQVFESSMNDKGLYFSIKIAQDVPKFLVLDGNRVRQVLMNLIGNAQKFTDQGKVEINVNSCYISAKKISIKLTIQVSDSGIGIEVGSMDQIFRNFEQHKKQNIQKYGGTGLGLAISRKLAEKMNGRLSATSEIGKGSVFTFELNDVAIASSITENIVCHSYQFDPAVIMVVDDVDTNRIVICKYLEPYPFEIVEARNGIEAVKLALQLNPDLILMDLRMPQLDGYQATKNIKEKLDIPIIAITASALEDKESKREKDVFDDYLRKPILKSKLLESIGCFLRHSIESEEIEPLKLKFLIKDEQKKEFNNIVTKRLLQETKNVASIGQFDRIESFAAELSEVAEIFKIEALQVMAEQLSSAGNEFDIEQIDLILKQLQRAFENFLISQ